MEPITAPVHRRRCKLTGPDPKVCECTHANYSHDLLGYGATGRCQAQTMVDGIIHPCHCRSYICAFCGEQPIHEVR